MRTTMKVDDEIRINVLNALLKKNSVKPSLKQLKKLTGYHKSTIKSSLNFLEEKNLIQGYGPKINFRALGYNLEVTSLLQADISKKDLFEKYLKIAKKDPHLYWLSGMLGVGNLNLVGRHIYADVESYQKHMQEAYYDKIPNIFEFLKDKQILFTTEPIYKNASRTKSIIEIIKEKKGFE